MTGPGPALSLAAVGHVEARPALIDRAARLLAPHWPDLTPGAVRRALADPAKVAAALAHVAPEAYHPVYSDPGGPVNRYDAMVCVSDRSGRFPSCPQLCPDKCVSALLFGGVG